MRGSEAEQSPSDSKEKEKTVKPEEKRPDSDLKPMTYRKFRENFIKEHRNKMSFLSQENFEKFMHENWRMMKSFQSTLYRDF